MITMSGRITSGRAGMSGQLTVPSVVGSAWIKPWKRLRLIGGGKRSGSARSIWPQRKGEAAL